MKEAFEHIKYDNRTDPKSFFEIIRIEELLSRSLDHDICKNHIVEFYIVFFVLEGEGLHTVDFTDYQYQKGSVLLIRKDQVHKFFKNSKVKGYLLIFTEEFIVGHLNKVEGLKSFQLFNQFLSFPKIRLETNHDDYDRFVSLVDQMDQEYKVKDEYSQSIIGSTLHVLITMLFRIKSKTQNLFVEKKYLAEFLSFQEMVEKYCFENKKVMYYAQKMGCSTKTLNTIVKTVVNKPAKIFIDEIAIMQIKRLLITTSQPIKEIAYTVGFDDPTNFFKYFKKYVGSSPEVFRKAHQ